MKHPPHLAIVGATGAVGMEILRVLERRNFPVGNLTLLASPRSAGKTLEFRGNTYPVKTLAIDAFTGVDIALFSAGASITREFAPAAIASGSIVVDNSSAHRMDAAVPLVIPEVNAAAALTHHGLIANPNCTTAVSLMAIAPLHRAFGVKTIVASSYQAVSGTGARAITELEDQVKAWQTGAHIAPEIYPHPIAFNLIPRIDAMADNGYTKEEMKFQNETRKILEAPGIRASITCVRVPVFRAHSVACTVQCERPVTVASAREVWAGAAGLQVRDEPASDQYPMPLHAAGMDDCLVGRARMDLALENAITFWISGDQLLKGAALNAVQIAELLL